MFDSICTLPLHSDLFTQSIHPSEPILTVGLATGHVQTFRLPSLGGEEDGASANGTVLSEASDGKGHIDTIWRTRRHKGSCRSVVFGYGGDVVYSAGTDGLVKAASTETGQVVSKIACPLDPATGDIDAPSLLHTLSPQTMLLATDSSALHIYDLRQKNGTFSAPKPVATHHPHDDYLSSLSPLPPSEASTSGFPKQWVSTGGTTLAVTDLRRGVLVRSEDQEEELLSSLFVGGLAKRGTSVGEKVLVGDGSGVLTLWERGQWDDQDERIIVSPTMHTGGGDSLDALCLVPDELGLGKVVAVGCGDGNVKFVNLKSNKVVDEVRHHDVEGVVEVGFDSLGRMISGGGSVVKVWVERDAYGGANEDDEKAEMLESNGAANGGDDSDDDDDSEEEPQREKGRKKRKKKSAGGDPARGKAMKFSLKGLD